MLNDLIRVGPPQGATKDLDLGIDKILNHDMKHDFEKELKALKAKDEPEKLESKIDKPIKDLDQVSKKSSGGIKRKMTKTNDDESDVEKPESDVKLATNVVKQDTTDKKISKVMVSEEGEVEIADDDDKNLQQVDPAQQAYILNLQAQMMAAEQAANGEAETAVDPALVMQPEMTTTSQAAQLTQATSAQAQPQFQYLTNAEQALLAEANEGEAMPVEGEQQLSVELPQQPQALEVAPQLKQTQMPQQPVMASHLENQKQAQDVIVSENTKEEKQQTALESKAYDILSKENANIADVKNLKQDAQVKEPVVEHNALNQTNAVLAQSNAEHDQSTQGDSQKQESSADQGSSKPKLESHHDLASQVSALHTQQRSFQSHLGAAGAAVATAKHSEGIDAMKDTNVKEIMNQAKFLVTKGGGEMTVKMTPEGMGEVHLKVALENGKINIEMNSQDKSVKKLIEESLSDLKSSLASHQMQVEHVKINNVAAVDTNNQAGTQSDLNHSNSHQNRQQQQEMNFQQNLANSNSGRQSRQQGSSHSGAQQPMMQAGVQTSARAASGRAAYTAANKGSSINMVA